MTVVHGALILVVIKKGISKGRRKRRDTTPVELAGIYLIRQIRRGVAANVLVHVILGTKWLVALSFNFKMVPIDVVQGA
jgi:hypothetical protein